ncbi:M14 family metallopeptidase [Rossellomorea sp. BNER]|uniref:M14 family metallopeptidase n=1 Tax=Rossellomorea sp. BNER TaxID=2962031 RepID=UPI003AF2261B|nr:M14 family metallopeptidase [Rossellomorea sp. BNER]
MKDLRQIWEIDGFLRDDNEDGVPDSINVSIELPDDLMPVGLIDFCGRLGFETTALSYHFFQNPNAEWKMKFVPSEKETGCRLVYEERSVEIFYESIESLNLLLQYLASKWPQPFLEVDGKITKVILRGNTIKAGGQSIKIEGSQQKPLNRHKVNSLSDLWNGTGFLMTKEASPASENMVGFDFQTKLSTKLLVECCHLAARIGLHSTKLHFPLTGENHGEAFSFLFKNGEGEAFCRLDENGQSIVLHGTESELVSMISYIANAKHYSEGGEFALWEKDSHYSEKQTEEILFRLDWEDEGEVERILQKCQEFEDETPDYVELFVSEPYEVRKKIKNDLQHMFKEAEICVRSAFKPAYFWIEEEILPILKGEGKVDSIHIECLKEETPDGVELPIRWIQELYPVDLLLEREIGIPACHVEFSLKEKADSTFILTTLNENRNKVNQFTLNVPVSQLDYLEKGKKVYPTSGQILLKKNGIVLHQESMPTDRERFYEFYQKEVLPLLWSKVEGSDKEQGFTKPLFDRIEIVAQMSEEERRLNLDEERISSMEALHEDLYFNTLDFFIVKGEETIGKGFPAPGGVYPFVKAVSDVKPKAAIVAYPWKEEEIFDWKTTSIFFKGESPVKVVMIEGNGAEKQLDLTESKVSEKRKRHNLPQNLVKQWVPTLSYRGEPIPVLEMFSETKEQFYSPLKLTTYKPTILIEAGHHANEVSSTPAILELMEELAVSRTDLLRKVNLVVIPLANPDGAKLHEKMVTDNPQWKHHAARYNAVGLEYSHVRYKRTAFGEADIVPLIMKKWAPDIVIDDHGIPSHEWIQPFAGYNSPPRFPVSYWMPNALIYGIGRELNEENYPIQYQNLQKIIESIGAKIEGTEIQELNQYWLDRYKKYGYQWLPQVFPIEQSSDFIFYKWPTHPNSNSTVSISRYSEWICADIISEAADETVSGEALERCKTAHKLFDLAIIETAAMKKQKSQFIYGNSTIEVKRARPMIL